MVVAGGAKVGNSPARACERSDGEDGARGKVDVRVDDIDLASLQELGEAHREGEPECARMDLPAELANFVVEAARAAAEDTELKREHRVIKCPHQLEGAQFCAATVHHAEDVENSNWLHRSAEY